MTRLTVMDGTRWLMGARFPVLWRGAEQDPNLFLVEHPFFLCVS